MGNKGVNVAYLSYDGLTDPLGQSQVLPYIVGLAKFGYRFTIFSFEKKNRLQSQFEEIQKQTDELDIKWVALKYHKYPAILSTIYDLLILWRRFSKEQSTGCFSIVHCRSYLTSLIGLRAKKKFAIKFIFDMRGFWADERVEGGLWNLKNPVYKLVYRYFKNKQRRFLENADQIVSLTESAKREIESWKFKIAPITVIPTCVDLNLFDPEKINKTEQSQLRAQLGIDLTDFVLLYLGSWGTWYLTDEMLQFFVNLKKEQSRAKFLIVSTDEIDLDNYPLQEDAIVTQVPRQSVPLYISIADLAICFIKPTFSKKASSATKLGEILAMNVPVITNPGWGDIEAMALRTPAIKFDSRNVFDSHDGNSRAYVKANLSIQQGVNSYLRIYADLIQKHVGSL